MIYPDFDQILGICSTVWSAFAILLRDTCSLVTATFCKKMAFEGTPLRRFTNQFDETALDESVDKHTTAVEYHSSDIGT